MEPSLYIGGIVFIIYSVINEKNNLDILLEVHWRLLVALTVFRLQIIEMALMMDSPLWCLKI
jgi:hypothetical protein